MSEEITLNLPDSTYKKIKACLILGGGSAGDIEAFIVDKIDQVLTSEIIGLASEGVKPKAPAELKEEFEIRRPAAKNKKQVVDYSVADGLGDEVDYSDEDATNVFRTDIEDTIPKTGGLTEETMDRDMEIGDPEHEAKTDAAEIKIGADKTPEQVFSEIADLPFMPSDEEDERLLKRNKKHLAKTRRAKVTQATSERETF